MRSCLVGFPSIKDSLRVYLVTSYAISRRKYFCRGGGSSLWHNLSKH